MTDDKTTSEITDMAVTMLRTGGDTTFDKSVFDSQIVKWLPYMEYRSPHTLDPAKDEKMQAVMEVFEHFKESHPEAPFKEFVKYVTELGMTPLGVSKIDHILRGVRMLKLSKRTLPLL